MAQGDELESFTGEVDIPSDLLDILIIERKDGKLNRRQRKIVKRAIEIIKKMKKSQIIEIMIAKKIEFTVLIQAAYYLEKSGGEKNELLRGILVEAIKDFPAERDRRYRQEFIRR